MGQMATSQLEPNYCFLTGLTVSLARPFRRRAFKTLLPFADFDLTKKPWVVARFLFEGLYVFDI